MNTSLSYVPRARAFSRRRSLSSITWGNLSRLGFVTAAPDVLPPTPVTIQPFPSTVMPGQVSPGLQVPLLPNPDTQPGAWPGLNPGGTVTATTLPAQVPVQQPVVVTPTSGPIPSPQTVAAATAPATSWLDEQLIPGINNSYLLLGGIAAFLFFGGKK
jgi:hypothetical protein